MKDPFDIQPITYEVNNHRLIMKPLPFKKFKKVLAIVGEAMQKIQSYSQKFDVFLTEGMDYVSERFSEIAPVLFDQGSHQFLNKEWIEDNITVAMAKKILTDAAELNGIDDFLSRARVQPQGTDLPTTKDPSSASSTTSSSPATNGGKKT